MDLTAITSMGSTTPEVLRDAPAVNVVKNIAVLNSFEAGWTRLGGAGNPINSFDFGHSFATVLGARQQLHVIATGAPQISAIAPLILNRRGVRCLTLLGAEMYEIQDFVYRDPAAVQDLANSLSKAPYPLYLNRVAAESPVIPALREAYRRRGVVVIRDVAGSPWIPLDDSWREPESHLNSGRRSDLRRARRNAEKLGRVSFEIITVEPQQVHKLMSEAFAVEAAGWKGIAGTALSKDPIRGEFFRRYLDMAAQKGVLRICFFRIEDRAIAAQIAIDNGRCFCLLRAGYDEEFARCSPGILLTRETIAFAARQGLQSYEFNGAVEPWTKTWTDAERPCCSVRAYPFSRWGLTKLAVDGWRSGLTRLRERHRVSDAR